MARYEFVKGLPVITMAEGKQSARLTTWSSTPSAKR